MIVGTAGHIDHGKTSLVRALTGVDTDRLKEEKARGISIDLGFAYLPAPDGSVLGFVDVPGHEKFIHNMLAGATGIDFVMLTVAADDGVMPQTREHLAIIDLLGIEHGVVALTKADLASASELTNISSDIRQLLQSTRLAKADVVPVSTVTGLGVDELRCRLFDVALTFGASASLERFRLAVDRCFTLTGVGTVVTGTVLSGTIATGDRVTISPPGLAARVRSIHAQNRPTERGSAGQRCALNLVGDHISKDAIARGDVVLDPSLHAPADRIDVMLRLLATEQKPVSQWTPVRLHHAAAVADARIVLLGDTPVAPGEEVPMQLVLDRPIAAAAGDRFVLRDTTAQRTIGGGKILDLRAPARKRRTAERIAQLRAHRNDDAQEALAALLDVSPYFVDLTAFSRDRALSEQQTHDLSERLGIIKASAATRVFALSASVWLRFRERLLEVVQDFHARNPELPGISLERLRLQLEPRLSAPAFLSVLGRLSRAKDIALDGARVRLPVHETHLTPNDAEVWKRVAPLIGGADRFQPPRLRDIATTLGIRDGELRRLFKLLARIGKVDEIAPDNFFLRATVAEMVRIAVELSDAAEDGQFTAAQFRDRMDNGRKAAIRVLEFFDRHGLTLRRGDARVINKPRLGLFRTSAEPADFEQTSSGREPSPVGRPDFKSGRAAGRSQVGSTPSLFRHARPQP